LFIQIVKFIQTNEQFVICTNKMLIRWFEQINNLFVHNLKNIFSHVHSGLRIISVILYFTAALAYYYVHDYTR